LPPNEQEEVFPALAPNFVAEIRSMSDSESSVHEKMCTWIEAGVEESDHYLLVMFIDYCY
jgi:Uma2 family endonuclease